MVRIKVDNVVFRVPKTFTILQACWLGKVQVPRFCFHDRIAIAGNCRICLVEVFKSSKPVIACTSLISDGIEIFTTSPLVSKAREIVLEFLLINHPLDCPVCDQGGECDLQDQAIYYGSGQTRFFFKNKRQVTLKNWGPLLSTVITRCIHCTRCIRFSSDSFGKYSSLGFLGRGASSEITFFHATKASNLFSGNFVDLCPVSSLTNKCFLFLKFWVLFFFCWLLWLSLRLWNVK